MNDKEIRKYHFFFSWQDESQEKWLEGLSRKGLHLEKAGWLGRFTFVEGSAGDYAYRLDFYKDKQAEDYLQLIQDAGWEYLGKQGGWHYWRKEVTGGRVPELFTDILSKRQKYQRLLTFSATSSPGAAVMYIIGAAIFKTHPGLHPEWFIVLYLSLNMAWLLVGGLNSVMVYRRINQLKKGE